MCGADVSQPGMGVFQFEDPPCKGTSDDEIYPAAHGDTGSVVGNLD